MDAKDIYAQIAVSIISHQETIIGPVAVEQAEQVPGLNVNWKTKQVSITGHPDQVISSLVESYKSLFGQISVEVSKEAASSLLTQLPQDGVPLALR